MLGSPLAAGLSAGLAALAVSPAAAAPNPTANIPLGPLPGACGGAPHGAICEDAVLRGLEGARAKLGLGRYRLPANFVTLRPGRQWLILGNLDRIAYSLPPIRGLTVTLNAIAEQGAQAHQDPNPFPAIAGLSGQTSVGFASNWAGGAPNALAAYYGWMYDDGYGSGNLDCTSPSAAGCWGHRQDILAFPHGHTLSMGAAVAPGQASYALTIVETSTAVWPYSYTWKQAKADGAGGG